MDVNPENPLGWWSFNLLLLTCCMVLCVTCMQRGVLLGGVGPATRKRNVFSSDSYTLKADFFRTMFVRVCALLGGSVAAAASALSVANANVSVKEPATGIGAPLFL